MAVRVLSVIPGEDGGSSMIFAKRQSSCLAALGLHVTDFYLTARTEPISVWREVNRLRRTLREVRPDLVHAHYGTVTALVCVIASSVPVVVTYRGSDLNPSPAVAAWRTLLGRLLSQLAALRACGIICVSDQLKSRLWWRRDRAVVIPSGVDLDHFSPRPRAEARQRLGWDDRPVVMFNCGLDPWVKRIEMAEASVELARREFPSLRFEVMRGDVDPARVPLLFNAADCLLVTSRFEGSPNVVKEALACNLPVVAVDVGDIRIRIEGVDGCFVVQPEPAALAQALMGVLRKGQRIAGRERVRELGQDHVAQRVRAVYGAAVMR